jgi:copper oxidase (laccase) domain-containing protein
MSLKLLMVDNKWFTVNHIHAGWGGIMLTCLACGGTSESMDSTTCDFICWMELHSNSCYETDSELVSSIAMLDNEWVVAQCG